MKVSVVCGMRWAAAACVVVLIGIAGMAAARVDVETAPIVDVEPRGYVYADANGDGYVDLADLLLLGYSWARSAGQQFFDPRCDFNHDSRADVSDLLLLAGGWGRPFLRGDITGDGRVDMADRLLLDASLGLRAGEAGYDSRCDLNHDDRVDTSDLYLLAGNWYKRGDADLDSYVDVADLLLLAASWSLSAGQAAYDCRCDFNRDDQVDLSDLLILAANWETVLQARIKALGLADSTNQAVLQENWADTSGWTILASGGGRSYTTGVDATYGGRRLTVDSGAADQHTDFARNISCSEPYVIELDWTLPATDACVRLCLASGNLGSGTLWSLEYNNGAWTLSTTDGGGPSQVVTPPDLVASKLHKILIAVNPVDRAVRAFCLYRYDIGEKIYTPYVALGDAMSLSTAPASIEFVSPPISGVRVAYYVSPISIWKCWGCTIGDSLAEGGPGYSPVPRYLPETGPKRPVNSFGCWIERATYATRRVLNFGMGGQQIYWVNTRLSPWVIGTWQKVCFIEVGTNNVNGLQATGNSDAILSELQTRAINIMSALDGAGIVAVMCTIPPRTNYATSGGTASKAQKDALRHRYNLWLQKAAPLSNALCVDVDAVLRDPSYPDFIWGAVDGSGAPIPPPNGYNADDVHLTVEGCKAMGTAIAEKMLSEVGN